VGIRPISNISQVLNITQELYSRIKAKLKVPRPLTIKKNKAAGIEFKKN